MPEHHAPRPAPDPNDRYEKSDLSIPGIAKGVVIYFIFTGLIGVVVLLGMMWLHQNTPEMVHDQIPPQPYPLLQNQTTAVTDIWNLRGREQYLLENYTYADPNHQYARVPVDSMIDKIAAEGPNAIEVLPKGYEATPQPPANAFEKPLTPQNGNVILNGSQNQAGQPPAGLPAGSPGASATPLDQQPGTVMGQGTPAPAAGNGGTNP